MYKETGSVLVNYGHHAGLVGTSPYRQSRGNVSVQQQDCYLPVPIQAGEVVVTADVVSP